VSTLLDSFREKVRRVWHYRVGPTAQQIGEAQQILSGREYYELYEDRYRQLGSQYHKLISKSELLVRREFLRVMKDGLFHPGAKLIDLGCGNGHNAFQFAQLGFQVTGVDIAPTAIGIATRLAAEKKLQIDFRVADVLRLADWADDSFDLADDIGCLHMLVRTEHRQRYLKSVRRILRPGGSFFLFNRVAIRDVRITDEDADIARSITWQEKHRVDNGRNNLNIRGSGFRNASMRQYKQELEAAGFDLVRSHRVWFRYRPYWVMLLARVPR
jgi:ubiquinone/menaquinone biosynthesis C-methylase UbiE